MNENYLPIEIKEKLKYNYIITIFEFKKESKYFNENEEFQLSTYNPRCNIYSLYNKNELKNNPMYIYLNETIFCNTNDLYQYLIDYYSNDLKYSRKIKLKLLNSINKKNYPF